MRSYYVGLIMIITERFRKRSFGQAPRGPDGPIQLLIVCHTKLLFAVGSCDIHTNAHTQKIPFSLQPFPAGSNNGQIICRTAILSSLPELVRLRYCSIGRCVALTGAPLGPLTTHRPRGIESDQSPVQQQRRKKNSHRNRTVPPKFGACRKFEQ